MAQAKFPAKFSFGASTAAYQIEGAWLQDNKSMSNWDNIAHSSMIGDNTTGDVVCNSYNLYHKDIAIMKEYGIKHYRMSISWPRILPFGFAGSAVNMKGVEHYRDLFRELLKAGITPYVTLFHSDLPSYLFIIGTGLTDPDFVNDFTNYADICYKYFGDLVKYWFTFNEPWCAAVFDPTEPQEEPTRPYLIGHQLLLAHASAVDLYRRKYKTEQKGMIGWVLNSEMFFPKDPSKKADIDAADRALTMQIDWFSEPLFTGDYPQKLKDIVKDRLPKFTGAQRDMLKGSADFYALNHYFTFLTEPERVSGEKVGESFWNDRNIKTSFDPAWKLTDTYWSIVPEGFYGLIKRVHDKWVKDSGIEIYITENGAAINEMNITAANNDKVRLDYLQRYISMLDKAITEGVRITKYFIWSLLDNFEWGSGVSKRFGIIRVEYGTDNPQRIPKGSLKWYSELIKSVA